MSYEEQLRWHLEELPPEPDQPACLDGSLRVREWAQHYPQVDVEPGFFRPLPPPPPPPSSSSSSPSASPAAEAAPPPSATSHQLVAAVLKEHAKSAAFREAKTAELAVRLDECDARMVCAVAAADGGGGGEAKGAKPPTLQSVLEDVEMFTATCRESYELFLRRVDPQALAPYMESVEQVAERIRPDKPRIAQLVGRLSRRYDELRSGRVAGGGDGKGPAGNNVSTFVHPDNLTEIKCHILRHLPIYVFPNADGTPHNPAVSSVYYDNDDLQLYTGRLLKQDEAIALRIRWYGAPDTPTVFVENKVHYEDWTGEPSTKSRFGLEESLANEFMAGTFTLDARIRELAAQGKLPQKEIEAMDRLAKDVQRVVREKQLRPMVRTFYHRTAFQIPGSAKVRLSIDEDLTFIREDANVQKGTLSSSLVIVVSVFIPGQKPFVLTFARAVGVAGAALSSEPDANWRRRDVGIDWPFQHLPENEVHHFPYAIMEVKLEVETGKEPPLWIRELMQSQLVS
ncbi:MAG: VTC domain-containing protein, partial [Olpidium bornovanus]